MENNVGAVPPNQKHLATPAAARYVSLGESTLEKMRLSGGGPRYFKLGRRVVYSTAALDQWLTGRECGSTSEYGVEPGR